MSNQNVASSEQADLKDLARKLSDAYHNTLQYRTLSEDQVIQSLQQLAEYNNNLPTSWFTPQLLDTLVQLKGRFATAASATQLKVLKFIIALYSSWLRRLTAVQGNQKQQLTTVMSTLTDVLAIRDQSYRAIQKEAWIGWVSLIGKSTELDINLINGMVNVLNNFTADHQSISEDAVFFDTLNAGVAHAIAQTSTLNEFEVEHCEQLLVAFTRFIAAANTVSVSAGSLETLGIQGAQAIMNALEHIVDVRSKEKPQTRAEADLNTLVHLVIALVEKAEENEERISPEGMAKIAVLIGTVRQLQFNQGKKTKKVLKLREKTEDYLLRQIDTLVHLSTKNHLNRCHLHEDLITFMVSRFLIQIPNDKLSTLKTLPVLLKLLTSTLLTSPETFNSSDILHRLKVSPAIKDELNRLVNQTPLFKEIGRISRAMAKIIVTLLSEYTITGETEMTVEGIVEMTLDRLVGFSYNAFFDWDQYKTSTATTYLKPTEENTMKQIDDTAWTVLKSLLFSFTVVLNSVAVDVPNGEGLIKVKHAAQDIISIFANLNFILEHLGEGHGRQAYEDTMTNAVAYLVNEDNRCELNRLISLAFKDYATQKFVPDNVESYELLSMVKQTRLTFFTDLSEQVMKVIDDKIFEQDILPVIYPILKWRRIENKELYESAHSCVITAFTSEKAVSKELAGIYGKILIESFPEPMNLEQLRYGFGTLIQALCGMDDALAWLTVNQLLQKINALKTNEKDIVLRNQYITVLIDLLKPLSLGPFFPSILNEIQKLVYLQESREIQKATMKLIFDTVSGPGISDMRRTEAVGWFLNLKRELNL